MKSVQIRSYFWSAFSFIRIEYEIYGVNLCISVFSQNTGKSGLEITMYLDIFHAMKIVVKLPADSNYHQINKMVLNGWLLPRYHWCTVADLSWIWREMSLWSWLKYIVKCISKIQRNLTSIFPATINVTWEWNGYGMNPNYFICRFILAMQIPWNDNLTQCCWQTVISKMLRIDIREFLLSICIITSKRLQFYKHTLIALIKFGNYTKQ